MRYILAEKWTHWRQDLWREVTETVHDGGKKVKQHTMARTTGRCDGRGTLKAGKTTFADTVGNN